VVVTPTVIGALLGQSQLVMDVTLKNSLDTLESPSILKKETVVCLDHSKKPLLLVRETVTKFSSPSVTLPLMELVTLVLL